MRHFCCPALYCAFFYQKVLVASQQISPSQQVYYSMVSQFSWKLRQPVQLVVVNNRVELDAIGDADFRHKVLLTIGEGGIYSANKRPPQTTTNHHKSPQITAISRNCLK
jgi:hypothetical protein